MSTTKEKTTQELFLIQARTTRKRFYYTWSFLKALLAALGLKRLTSANSQ